MDKKDFEDIDEIVLRMKNLLVVKGHDYSGVTDTLKNFYSLEDIGIPAETNLFIRLTDKYNRLRNFIKTKQLWDKKESVDDTLIDLACYCVLFCLLLQREKKK